MRKIMTIALLVTLQACAFQDSTLSIGVMEDADFNGPLGEIASTSFKSVSLEDARTDQERIGYKKNGYGAKTADILPDQPVTEIVGDGIVQTLRSNGHTISDSGITIRGKVTQFWFETDVNFWTVEFLGDVSCELEFLDASGQTLYKNSYTGSYSEKKGGGLSKTWTEVMNKALAALLEDLAFDEDLAEQLAQ